jgi:hypothetical protein
MNNYWLNIIGSVAEELISEFFSDTKNDSKSESNQKHNEEETQDLGYAVVVDDNGDEIRNH